MKKLFFISIAVLLIQIQGSAQSIGLFGGGGYTFGDDFDTEFGYGRVNESGHWNAGVLFNINEAYGIKLSFQQQPTTGSIYDYIYGTGSGDLNISYIMAAGQRYMPFSDVAKGYFGIELGMAIFGSPEANQDVEKFAWGAGLGVELNPSPVIGIRIGGQMLVPVQAFGGGFYVGTGGSGAGVSTFSTLWQFGFNGALVIYLSELANR